MPESFSVSDRAKSIRHALTGIATMLSTQHNAWVHLLATLLVIVAGISAGVSKLEWCLLVLAITSVWVAEALNTALERLCDVASPDFHPLVKQAKDVAAGAVLLCATGAAIIGAVILLPHWLD